MASTQIYSRSLHDALPISNRLLEMVIRQTREGKPACGAALAYSTTDVWGPGRSIKDQSPVDLPTSCENFLDCRQEIFRLKGLRYVRIRALLLAPELVAFLSLGRTEDDRDVLEPVVTLQIPAGLKAVAARHDHVQDDEVGLLDGKFLLEFVGGQVGDDRVVRRF